jgi:hypothetical protein
MKIAVLAGNKEQFDYLNTGMKTAFGEGVAIYGLSSYSPKLIVHKAKNHVQD